MEKSVVLCLDCSENQTVDRTRVKLPGLLSVAVKRVLFAAEEERGKTGERCLSWPYHGLGRKATGEKGKGGVIIA